MGVQGFVISDENKRSQDKPPGPEDDFWYDPLRFGGSKAGQQVNATTAERIAAVYACKTAICESVAMLPATVFDEVDEKRKEKLKEHPLFKLLRHSPNSAMDSFTWFECMQDAALDTGNAYAYKLRTRSGKLEALIPLDATRVTVKVVFDSFNRPALAYTYNEPGGKTLEYTADEIFHLKYRSKDGYKGRSPITVAAESFGFPLALLEHGNQTFANGAFLSGFLKTAHAFKDDESRDAFMESLRKYVGSQNSGKFALLESGVEYEPHQQTSRDAQFLELSEFSVVQVARIFRVPPVIIQAMDKGMSYASIEQLATFFVQYTIQPWVTRWERAIKNQLLGGKGEDNLFVRFNVSALIRGDLKSRVEAIVQQLQYGLKTINEGRNMLDDNAIEDAVGDEPLVSHNLVPASKILEEPEPEPEPDPEPEPEEEEPEKEPESDEEEETEAGGLPEPEPVTEEKQEKSKRFEPLFEELLGRIVRKEAKAKARAVKKPGFMKWAEEFVENERGYMLETLTPAVLAYDGEDHGLDRFVDAYLEERKADLLENVAEAWSEPVAERVTRWKGELLYFLEEILF